MQQKTDQHIFTGMRRDLDISKHKPEFLFDAYNIRINPREGDTLLGITNERGPLYKSSYSGKYVGHIVIDKDYIVLFLTSANVIKNVSGTTTTYISTNRAASSNETRLSNKDAIIKINVSDYSYSYLFIGNLNLSKDNPIQGVYRYESSRIKKIYWVDGRNQPRMINIEKEETSIEDTDSISTRFDFIQTLKLNETVTVTKRLGGIFAPGIIQYAFSYFYLNGQESNIFYTTPLYYIGNPDTKTVSPEGTASDAFEINITNLETKFDYVRIYSIHRTSLNATPECKIVADVKIDSTTLTYIDYGNTGSLITPLELLYVGGQVIIPNTIAFKDATLFLANYKLNLNLLRNASLSTIFTFDDVEAVAYNTDNPEANDASIVPKFKRGEHYIFGIQVQDKYGRWSDPFSLGEKTVEGIGNLNIASCHIAGLPEAIVKVRGVCIYPTVEQRKIIATGALNPTLYQNNILDADHRLFYSSWFVRPEHSLSIKGYQFEHNRSIFESWVGTDYVQHLTTSEPDSVGLTEIENGGTDDKNTNFVVSYKLTDFYSPDAEFDYLSESTNANYEIKHIGDIMLNLDGLYHTMFMNQIRVTAPSPLDETIGEITRRTYFDINYFIHNIKNGNNIEPQYYPVYTWNSSGSITEAKDDTNNYDSTLNIPFNTLKYNKSLRWIDGKTMFVTSPTSLTGCTYKSYLEENGNSSLEFDGNYYLGQVETILPTVSGAKYYTSDPTNINWVTKFTEKRIIDMKYKTASHLVLSLNNPLYFNDFKGASLDNRTSVPVYGFDASGTKTSHSASNIASFIRSYLLSIYRVLDTTGRTPINEIFTTAEGTTSLPSLGSFYAIGYYPPTNDFYLYKIHTLTSGNYLYDFWVENIGGTDLLHTYTWGGSINLLRRYYDSEGNMHGYNNSSFTWDDVTYNYVDFAGSYILEDGKLTRYTNSNEQEVDEDELGVQVPEAEFKTYRENHLHHNQIETTTRLLLVDLINKNPAPLQDDVPWVPASTVPADVTNGNAFVVYDIGDTWLQKYRCIKTYPFSKEDENSVTEILTFDCPTRTNLNGRYSTAISPPVIPEVNRETFSLVNKVYSNQNNFFNYSKIKETETVLEETTNAMTWAQENIPNSDTDTNVALSLINNYLFDEKITSLVTNNLGFYAFHPFSISKISFNPRVEVSPSDGVPIELSTSKRLYGSDTIVNEVGTSNKKSILVTDNGIFFVDDSRRELYLFGNDEKLTNISDSKNFNSWFNAQTWLDNSRLFYDKVNGDLYLVGEEHCLVFNTGLQEFTSFMSYEGVPTMFNVGYNFYAFDWYYDRAGLDDNYTSLYHMFKGNYNEFFGMYKPVHISFISNADAPLDKIFTNIETRMDVYNGDTLNHSKHFDYIKVWNEYQDTGVVPIDTSKFNHVLGYTSGKKKFRIWRSLIPRDSGSINRIRNTWTNIKLGFTPPQQAHNTVSNLVGTINPNIAQYYNNVTGHGIQESNTEEINILHSPTLNSSTSSYDTLRMLLHDINVKYFI